VTSPSSFEDVVQRVLAGEAPPQVRAAAARGALPLSRAALVRLQVFLRADEDPEIRAQAEESLRELPRESLLEVLRDEECGPEVLEHFAGPATRDPAIAERIVFHRDVPAGALATLASRGTADVIDLVLINEERLRAEPDLLNRLAVNPALRAVQRGRILELLDRASRSAAAARAAQEGTGEPEAGDAEAVGEEFEEAAELLQVDIGELYTASEILGGEELRQSDDPEIRTAYERILMLNVAQKAILAMRGGREERMILVRDTNKLVALGVLRNPRLVEEDVEGIARMRNVTDEVLRKIGQTRGWTKSYAIITALINNPRTPQGISTNFIPRLQNQDLKRLSNSKDVPELIRRMAKRTLDTRNQRKSGARRH
jgi:hypothetical protein